MHSANVSRDIHHIVAMGFPAADDEASAARGFFTRFSTHRG